VPGGIRYFSNYFLPQNSFSRRADRFFRAVSAPILITSLDLSARMAGEDVPEKFSGALSILHLLIGPYWFEVMITRRLILCASHCPAMSPRDIETRGSASLELGHKTARIGAELGKLPGPGQQTAELSNARKGIESDCRRIRHRIS
jgi:hypothetical protein